MVYFGNTICRYVRYLTAASYGGRHLLRTGTRLHQFTRVCVRGCVASLSNERADEGARVWERVVSRRDGETLIPGDVSPAPRSREEAVVLFLFPRCSSICMLTRGTREPDNGGGERWESRVWETLVRHAVARAARISAGSFTIILLERSHANEESRRDDCRFGTRGCHRRKKLRAPFAFSARKPRVIGFRVARY